MQKPRLENVLEYVYNDLNRNNQAGLTLTSKQLDTQIRSRNKNINNKLSNAQNWYLMNKKENEKELEDKLLGLALLATIFGDVPVNDNNYPTNMSYEERNRKIQRKSKSISDWIILGFPKYLQKKNTNYSQMIESEYVKRVKRNFKTTFAADILDIFLMTSTVRFSIPEKKHFMAMLINYFFVNSLRYLNKSLNNTTSNRNRSPATNYRRHFLLKEVAYDFLKSKFDTLYQTFLLDDAIDEGYIPVYVLHLQKELPNNRPFFHSNHTSRSSSLI
jgi:hypothetical protein